MSALNNVIDVSKRFLTSRYKCESIADDELNVIPIKGYLTTNVYKLSLLKDGTSDNYYIKESSDLNNIRYNKYIEEEYNNTKYIDDNFSSNTEISVVTPLKYFDDDKMFFMKEIKGQRLDNIFIRLIFFRNKTKLIFITELCKKWLNEFHKIKPASVLNSEVLNFHDSEYKKIKLIHDRSLDNCAPSEVEDINKFYSKLYDLSNEISLADTDITLKHNDFAPWNVLFHEGGITVYDFADIQIDYKYYDLIYFVHSINKLSAKVPFNTAMFDFLQEKMLEGTGISENTKSYYLMYFYLQDIELLLRKIKVGGIKSYVYRFKYMAIKNKLAKYLY